MPDGCLLAARTGCAICASGVTNPRFARRPNATVQAFRATLHRSARYERRCPDCAAKPDGLSKRTLAGRLRARPANPFTAGIDSTNGMRKRESCTWAPEISASSGSPRSSTSKWCLLPSLPRSVGFRPVCSPPAGAGTLAASTQARSHMIWSCSGSLRRIASWIRCQTPASLH